MTEVECPRMRGGGECRSSSSIGAREYCHCYDSCKRKTETLDVNNANFVYLIINNINIVGSYIIRLERTN